MKIPEFKSFNVGVATKLGIVEAIIIQEVQNRVKLSVKELKTSLYFVPDYKIKVALRRLGKKEILTKTEDENSILSFIDQKA